MPFLIETFDKPDCQALRLEVRQAHLEYLDANVVTLLACGAKLSDDGEPASGGLYLVDLDSSTILLAVCRCFLIWISM